MRHVREVDSATRTVRHDPDGERGGPAWRHQDRCKQANEAFAGPVPKELMDYLEKNKSTLLPGNPKAVDSAGGKTSGSWEEVFGKGPGRGRGFHGLALRPLHEPGDGGGQEGVPLPCT